MIERIKDMLGLPTTYTIHSPPDPRLAELEAEVAALRRDLGAALDTVLRLGAKLGAANDSSNALALRARLAELEGADGQV